MSLIPMSGTATFTDDNGEVLTGNVIALFVPETGYPDYVIALENGPMLASEFRKDPRIVYDVP